MTGEAVWTPPTGILVPKAANLYLKGLTREGQPRTMVNAPAFWANARTDQDRGSGGEFFMEEVAKESVHRRGSSGIFVLDLWDKFSHRILQRIITKNVETDNGIGAILKTFGSGGAGTLGQYLCVSTEAMTATQGTTQVAGTITTINVSPNWANGTAHSATNNAVSFNNCADTVSAAGAPGHADPVTGSGIIWTFGTANTEYASGSSTQASASTIATTSMTSTKTHTAGEIIVAGPATSDEPAASPAGAVISAAIAAVYNNGVSGNGIGLRNAYLAYTWAAGVLASASYTSLWVVTFATTGAWTAAGTYAHTVSSPLVITGSVGLTATYTATL